MEKREKVIEKKRFNLSLKPELVAMSLVLLVFLFAGGTILVSKIAKNFESLKTGESSRFLESSNDGNSASFSSSDSSSIESVAKKLAPSVVSIIGTAQSRSIYFYGYGTQTASAGTGVIVTADGYILTNKHVVEDSSNIQVILADGTTYENVKVAATDPLNDIAYLKISNVSDLTPAELGDSKTLNIGQEVIAIGNALGQFDGTVTRGIVSGVNRTVTAGSERALQTETLTDMIQTDAAINSGNSGGPLVNAKGQVIGINTAVADANGIGFAIPISATKGMLKSLSSGGKASRAILGVNYVSLTPAIAKENDLSVKVGAWISAKNGNSIKSGSAAAKAGLKDNDIIVAVNGIKVGSAGSVASLVSEYSAGETVKLTVLRNDQEIELSAILDAYSE